MAMRDQIVELLDQELKTATIADSSCNGLQVLGTHEVRRVGLAVDACLESYTKAHEAGCQLLIVHHGLIWGGLKSITGRHYEHIRYLLDHGINLYASHLPLDLHPQYGNNIGLARLLDLQDIRPFGEYHGALIGYQGTLAQPTTPADLAQRLSAKIGGTPLVLPYGKPQVRTIGIVSGGAADTVEQAAQAKLDCYVTGEPVHYALQLTRDLASNVVFLGHYHSEKLGVQALGKLLHQRFGVEAVFLDVQAFTAHNELQPR